MPDLPFVVSLFLLITFTPLSADVIYKGRIHHWVDGDTVDIQFHDLEIRLRLQGIDTPERGEAWWKRARKELREITEDQDLSISIRGWERGCRKGNPKRGSRFEAVIFLADGRSVNDLMVNRGYARRWCQEPWQNLKEHYGSLEEIARSKQIGVWGDKAFNFICTVEDSECDQ